MFIHLALIRTVYLERIVGIVACCRNYVLLWNPEFYYLVIIACHSTLS
jgi:hypothetical protein